MGIDDSNKGFGIAIDKCGNVYVTGSFLGFALFGPVQGDETILLTSTISGLSTVDPFIAKLDNNGNWLWAEQIGGGGFNE